MPDINQAADRYPAILILGRALQDLREWAGTNPSWHLANADVPGKTGLH